MVAQPSTMPTCPLVSALNCVQVRGAGDDLRRRPGRRIDVVVPAALVAGRRAGRVADGGRLTRAAGEGDVDLAEVEAGAAGDCGIAYEQAIALVCALVSASCSCCVTVFPVTSMMTASSVPPAWASDFRLAGAICPSAEAGLKMPTTKVRIGLVPLAAPLRMLEIPGISLGAHSAGGNPGMNPPGSPSVTSTIATLCAGLLLCCCSAQHDGAPQRRSGRRVAVGRVRPQRGVQPAGRAGERPERDVRGGVFGGGADVAQVAVAGEVAAVAGAAPRALRYAWGSGRPAVLDALACLHRGCAGGRGVRTDLGDSCRRRPRSFVCMQASR